MPTPAQPPAFPFESIDAERVEDALARLGPKWTTWSAMILAQENRPMRVRDISDRLPFVSETLVSKRLATMHADGLVTRPDNRRGAPYQLTALGESLTSVHHTLSDWSRAHLLPGRMAEAERVDDALRRLNLRDATAVVQALGTNGPMRFVHISEEAGLYTPWARERLLRLQSDGLVTRTGSRHGDPYALTDAGQALGAVYATIEHWSEPITGRRASPASRPVAATRPPRRYPAGGGRCPDSGGSSAQCCRADLAVQPCAAAATAGAGGCDRPVDPGPGTVSVVVRARAALPLPRRPRARRPTVLPRTRARSPPMRPEFDHAHP
ncbi:MULTISPECIES: winged helix-turn-helix transcriptional regulator [unclassified Streptomyces]|uniref:winged helix-turn-helix transcriptional regulator n=1 Tax=unclassified Streptomyces TaxID=2593676 RepID=UPI0001C1942B|nr:MULTISPECIES: winged helix-turn-helix transcriptional regulator [unclassified Streptomyces]AEN10809.1 transcriptional regulator, HxlR family [Streptomyces sp. SirexAA-E]PZX41895.1 HxlR family transcriptional regulator [Streptomyces sp. DvalAA-21]RAJ38292.1 HxlR family transcriptional regulator [Streptomyces sp. DpondAA-E10]RAJ52140.1 HxlR family transcriptional regulator [Streptomyces sp. DpondAA-A50]SCD70300.1 transcriptional regulator, HxlR family [Streptomyces sp. DpondAA-F4a]